MFSECLSVASYENSVADLELLSGTQLEKTPRSKHIMDKNYTVVWWEASFPFITHRPVRLYLLKGPFFCHTWKYLFRQEIQWSHNLWFVLQLSSVTAKNNFFPDKAANGVIIYTTRVFQKRVHRSSLNNHSLKISWTVGTSEWAVQEKCLSDGQTDPSRHSRNGGKETGEQTTGKKM